MAESSTTETPIDSVNDAPTGETGEQPAVSLVEEPAPEPTAEEKYAELHDQYLRLAADFDNFRKRRAQEVQNSRKYAAEGALNALIPVLDNLERAEKSLTADADPKLLYQSFQMMRQQLVEALEMVGLQPINAEGQAFDPMQHEAVAQHETADSPADTVIMVQQKGYLLSDRVLRPASVIVAKAPENEGNTPSNSDTANPFSQASSTQKEA